MQVCITVLAPGRGCCVPVPSVPALYVVSPFLKTNFINTWSFNFTLEVEAQSGDDMVMPTIFYTQWQIKTLHPPPACTCNECVHVLHPLFADRCCWLVQQTKCIIFKQCQMPLMTLTAITLLLCSDLSRPKLLDLQQSKPLSLPVHGGQASAQF